MVDFNIDGRGKGRVFGKRTTGFSVFRHYMMGKDFIDRKPRYCIWLVGADPGLLKNVR